MRQVRASDRDETCAASNVHGEASSAIKADAHEEMTLSLSAALVARMCSLSEAHWDPCPKARLMEAVGIQ